MLSTLIGAATTAAIAAIGWIVKEYRSTIGRQSRHFDKIDDALKEVENRTLVIETRANKSEPSLEELKKQQTADGVRLAAVEIGIATIKESIRSIESHHQEISGKLDKIPELTVALQQFGEVCKSIVPRTEVEARLNALDQRFNDLVVK